MTIKFNQKESMEKFNAKKSEYMNVVKNENATPEQHEKAFNEMFNALQSDLSASIISQAKEEARNEMGDNAILASRGVSALTSEERQFFNAVALSGGFADSSILPKTTVLRVFEQLEKDYPFLGALGIVDLGAVTRYIDSDPTKMYAWGNLFEGIAGQVATAFTEKELTQLKLTAFAVIPNDMLELGPEYIERYVRTLLVQSYSTGLEFGFIKGAGPAAKQPVGLMKDVNATTGAVTDKVSSGTLTFAPSAFGEIISGELLNVVSALSVDGKGNQIDVTGKVVMVVNPADAIAVQFRNTIQTSNGQWVTALPYAIQMVSSEQVDVGKAIFFVQGRYSAILSGGVQVKRFDQTLAIEDATLWTLKQFATGEPRDNKAALVYDLNITYPAVPGGGAQTPAPGEE